MTFPHRGDIYLVEFDPARGHEIRKTRPALVIQNNAGNQFGQVTIVAAITSKLSVTPYPVVVVLAPNTRNGRRVLSSVQLGQIRSVDRERLVRRLGTLDAAATRKVDQAQNISLGLVDF
jgi:mRNA interferase MazF